MASAAGKSLTAKHVQGLLGGLGTNRFIVEQDVSLSEGSIVGRRFPDATILSFSESNGLALLGATKQVSVALESELGVSSARVGNVHITDLLNLNEVVGGPGWEWFWASLDDDLRIDIDEVLSDLT